MRLAQLQWAIRIDEGELRGHLDKLGRGTVEETLNALLDEEADRMCLAQRYERSPDRIDTRAGLICYLSILARIQGNCQCSAKGNRGILALDLPYIVVTMQA